MKSPEQVKKFIEQIPLSVRDMTYEELVQECNDHFPKIPLTPMTFENKKFEFKQHEFGGYNVVYRGRKITDPKKRGHKTVSDISYIGNNSLEKIESFGRSNRSQESMFYGSLRYSTACFETLSKGLDFKQSGSALITCGTWIVEESLKIIRLPYSKKHWSKLSDIVDPAVSKMSKDKVIKQWDHLEKIISNELDLKILELFADAFATIEVQTEQDYYLSNYYKDRIFNQIRGFHVVEDFDTIMFPSIPSSYEEMNLVIKPEAVDAKLKFLDAMMVWVTMNQEKIADLQFIPIKHRIKANKSGDLLWR